VIPFFVISTCFNLAPSPSSTIHYFGYDPSSDPQLFVEMKSRTFSVTGHEYPLENLCYFIYSIYLNLFFVFNSLEEEPRRS
jgi:hypothetical protein